jgi:DNA replication initiation complex subunit (GINS family)
MQEHQSIKRVYAEPMDRLVAEEKGLVRDIKNETEDGYIVVYKVAAGIKAWMVAGLLEEEGELK